MYEPPSTPKSTYTHNRGAYITAPLMFPSVFVNPTDNVAFVMCCCEVQHVSTTKRGMFRHEDAHKSPRDKRGTRSNIICSLKSPQRKTGNYGVNKLKAKGILWFRNFGSAEERFVQNNKHLFRWRQNWASSWIQVCDILLRIKNSLMCFVSTMTKSQGPVTLATTAVHVYDLSPCGLCLQHGRFLCFPVIVK